MKMRVAEQPLAQRREPGDVMSLTDRLGIIAFREISIRRALAAPRIGAHACDARALAEVGLTDPLTFSVIPVLLAAATLLARLLPARRATTVDPEALRYE